MSVEALTWVFKHSEATLAERLVLLALADYAHDDGTMAFPRVAKLALKARVSERTVERCLQSLVEAGRIEQTGATKRGVKAWRIVMDSPDNMSGDRPDDMSGESPTGCRVRPDNSSVPLIEEPLLSPSIEPSRRRSAPTREQAPLSHLLADLLEANGVPAHKRKVTKGWAEAERLLLDRDGRDPAEAERLLRWATSDTFWKANVLSMAGFREKYDTLRLQAERGGALPSALPEYVDA